MSDRIFELLRGYFGEYGYWTIALALLLENAGVPVPGETVLLFASFLAYSQNELRLPWIIVIGTLAAACGDNIGYAIGRHGGRPLLNRWRHVFHLSPRHILRGEHLFNRHGPLAVFLARFIFGLRVLAGPLAGVLRMRWRAFATFNALGAITWVTAVSLVGYFFGRHWDKLVRAFKELDLVLVVLLVLLLAWFWIRQRGRANSSRAQTRSE